MQGFWKMLLFAERKSMSVRRCGKVRIYLIDFRGLELSTKHEAILAENMDEAFKVAMKLLAEYRKNVTENAKITSIREEYEVTVVD